MPVVIWILRILASAFGTLFLLIGVAALGCLAAVLAAGLGGQPLGQVWFEHDPLLWLFHSPSIQLAQVLIERKLQWPELWSPGITTILNWPSWQALTALWLGALLLSAVLVWYAMPRRRK